MDDVFDTVAQKIREGEEIDSTPVDGDNIVDSSSSPTVYAALLLRDFFGLSPEEARSPLRRDKLKELYEFAVRRGDSDKNSIYTLLNSIEQRIGAPKAGITRLDNIRNYAKLLDSARSTLSAIEGYENQNINNDRQG